MTSVQWSDQTYSGSKLQGEGQRGQQKNRRETHSSNSPGKFAASTAQATLKEQPTGAFFALKRRKMTRSVRDGRTSPKLLDGTNQSRSTYSGTPLRYSHFLARTEYRWRRSVNNGPQARFGRLSGGFVQLPQFVVS